jgi:excinuclease ABC subunit C
MRTESESRNYEQVISLREWYLALKQLLEEQKITSGRGEDEDSIGIAGRDGMWIITLMIRRKGKIIGKRDYTVRGGTDERGVLDEFLSRYYSSQDCNSDSIPPTVLLPFPIRNDSILQHYVQQRQKKSIRFLVPSRGTKRKLVELASRNAAHAASEAAMRGRASALQELKRVLRLKQTLQVIECFDVATLLGDHSVAGMVRFAQGSFDKRHYRAFRIRYTPERNDVDMLKEAMERRYQRLVNEKSSMPDVIMVDGGKPQVNGIKAVLENLGLRGHAVVGLAKRFEHLYTGDREPIVLEKSNQALRLLMAIRDETHRFAHTYHLNLRTKRALSSKLEGIPGVGKRLAGTVLEAMQNSREPFTLAFLTELKGIGEKRAKRIYEALAQERAPVLHEEIPDPPPSTSHTSEVP